MQDLKTALVAFRDLVNGKDSVKKLIRGWEPFVQVECVDGEEQYTLIIRNAALDEIRDGVLPHDHTVMVRGNRAALVQVFDGTLNPAQAVIDGLMEVYGLEKDMIKLDALTLLLWEA